MPHQLNTTHEVLASIPGSLWAAYRDPGIEASVLDPRMSQRHPAAALVAHLGRLDSFPAPSTPSNYLVRPPAMRSRVPDTE